MPSTFPGQEWGWKLRNECLHFFVFVCAVIRFAFHRLPRLKCVCVIAALSPGVLGGSGRSQEREFITRHDQKWKKEKPFLVRSSKEIKWGRKGRMQAAGMQKE
mmetsp:Transcript_26550/g.52137  ORF Transcript_26550/g.52137 Transcript_26550/m.52137 type:complete len:103 (-) Transcript_26550:505-813(-)